MTAASFRRHDLGVVRRTTVGRLMVGLAVAAMVGSVVVGRALSNGPLTVDFLAFSLWLVTGTAVPLGALLTASVTLAADRESGRHRLLFGTPLTSGDVYLGTLASRAVLTCVAVAAGFAVLSGVLAITDPGFIGDALVVAVPTVLVCLCYTAVGIAVSAVSPTRLRAVGVALGFYVWSLFWPQIVGTVAPSNAGRTGPGPGGVPFEFLARLSPFGAYSQAATPKENIYAVPVTDSLLSTPAMLAVLLAWTTVPAAAGYWAFRTAEF